MEIPVKLIVGIDDRTYKADPGGFCSHDELDWLVAAFCRRYDIPYSTPFVSIVVCANNEIPRLAKLYGALFELRSSVIDEVAVVCAGDFHTQAVNAVEDLIQSQCETENDVQGKEIDERLKQRMQCFTAVSGDHSERKRLLLDAAEEVQSSGQSSKNNVRYAEARMFRCLRRSDCVNPDLYVTEAGIDALLDVPGDRSEG